MSTFQGYVEEFPEIRIDSFRVIPGKKPPLAAFLSHVHSDHLRGLESLRAPLVYCSPATRELLLRLETYPHRMNFAKGVLECRKQHYKHLRTILRTIPLNTPTEVELRLGVSIQVTLLDANHCPGAVMFLIEDKYRAILYTGDIRSEPWWVNTLVRNPVMIPFTHGLRRLEKLYLDTTFASKSSAYGEFATKAAGLQELVATMLKYPKDTIFHVHAWTLGYEEVWIALSHALGSQVHVDDYKGHLYRSLATRDSCDNPSHEGSALFGFKFGNRYQQGCLTDDQTVRLHSCEFGTGCPASSSSSTVFVTPIISRLDGDGVLPEVGAGRGGGDLNRTHELELDDLQAVEKFVSFCTEKIQDQKARTVTLEAISKVLKSESKKISLDSLDLDGRDEEVTLEEFASMFAKLVDPEAWPGRGPNANTEGARKSLSKTMQPAVESGQSLPKRIVFPYSRHSSYGELCHLVEALKPKDVYPCTTDDESWSWDVSIANLFGHLCSGDVFAHDQEMRSLKSQKTTLRIRKRQREAEETSRISSQTRKGKDEESQDGFDGRFNDPASPSESDHLLTVCDGVNHTRQSYHTTDQSTMREQECSTSNNISPVETSPPNRKLRGLRSSFYHQVISAKSPGIEIASMLYSTQRNTACLTIPNTTPGSPRHPRIDSDSKRTLHWTRAEVIELPDEELSGSGIEEDTGELMLEDLAGASIVTEPKNESQSSSTSTHLTLSDIAFESQGSGTGTASLRHRKEAYKAAKGLNGGWGIDHGLVSSGADHGAEEMEL